MDLPTYTNIWRIEKRLYKLYDFRLPAPLPINWIAVFAGITVPYILLLVALGLPFNHTLVWLYVLPPGVLTWLTTRPVIESKRLHELLESQIRYLAEPRVWCRMAPLAEKDQITVTARVWHSNRVPRERTASMAALLERGSLARRKPGVPLRPPRVPVPAAGTAASGLATAVGDSVAAGSVAGGTVAGGAVARGTVAGGMVAGSTVAGRTAAASTAAASALAASAAPTGAVAGGTRDVARGGPGRAFRRGGAAKKAAAGDRAIARGTAKGRAASGTAAELAAEQVAPAPPLPAYGATRQPAALGGALARPAAAPVLSAGQPHVTPAVWPAVPASPGTRTATVSQAAQPPAAVHAGAVSVGAVSVGGAAATSASAGSVSAGSALPSALFPPGLLSLTPRRQPRWRPASPPRHRRLR